MPVADASPVHDPLALPVLEEAQLASFGIRRLEGRHLTLYTDLPQQPAVEDLPLVFDLAVPRWCEFFDTAPQNSAGWRWNAYLIDDPTRFRAAGLLPEDLPDFLHGYQRGREIWLYEQPSDYYRRHLLLHEGTHGWMRRAFGGSRPPWYEEGVAELLATHHWDGARLQLPHFPNDRDDTAYWGRLKIIRTEIDQDRGKTLEEIMEYGPTAHLELEPYAWSWAAAVFLDHTVREPFREAAAYRAQNNFDFQSRFRGQLQEDWPWLQHQWQQFVFHLDYGFNLEREQIVRRTTVPIGDEPLRCAISATRGWQSTGWWLEKGTRYEISITGRYQLAGEPEVWWSEPGGVTLRYYGGLPLGIVLAAIVDETRSPQGISPLARPDPLGTGGSLAVTRSGTMYVRVNDAPAELDDNAGRVEVSIRRLADGTPASRP